MNTDIVVSMACQTGGIAATLRAIFPEKLIKPIFVQPAANDVSAMNVLTTELKDASIWITEGRFELAQGLALKVVKVPILSFGAFHPDLCYARKKSTNELTKYHYNSQIAIWAFNNQIETSDAAMLFNHSTFRALGYFDRWAQSVEHLKSRILLHSDITDKEFDRFFLTIKRKGVFMHTLNHPRAETIVEFSKLIATKLGANRDIVEREIVIPDTLSASIWPLYPEIGQELGLNGNYFWRIDNQEVEGLRAYLDLAYQKYSEQGILPSDLLSCSINQDLDKILSNQVRTR